MKRLNVATRSLNSTGRSRITHQMFDAVLDSQNSSPTIDITWDLSDLKLPSESSLFVDVSNDRVEKRFSLSEPDLDIGQIVIELGPEFVRSVARLRLIAVIRDSSNIPVIRAESVTVSFSSSGESSAKSLLVVQPVNDLKAPWELSFVGGDVILNVSNEGGLWSSHLRLSPLFKVLVIGPIVYQVALELLTSRGELGRGMERWQELLVSYGLEIEDSDDLDIEELMKQARDVSLEFQASRKTVEYLLGVMKGVDE